MVLRFTFDVLPRKEEVQNYDTVVLFKNTPFIDTGMGWRIGGP